VRGGTAGGGVVDGGGVSELAALVDGVEETCG
jgi:hypothetical protein